MNVPKQEMETILGWVKIELRQENAAPWEWFQLMKLNETLLAFLSDQYKSPTMNYAPERFLQVVKSELVKEEL